MVWRFEYSQKNTFIGPSTVSSMTLRRQIFSTLFLTHWLSGRRCFVGFHSPIESHNKFTEVGNFCCFYISC